MNKIIIKGRLTRDPELRANGSVQLVKYTVAVDREYAKAGEEKETDFFNCVSFGKQTDYIETLFHKGDLIVVEGRLEIKKWTDKDGTKHETAEIIGNPYISPFSIKRREEPKQVQRLADFIDASDNEGLPFA